eukprot:scaffold6058_cov96-Cylindrotheca_fusiformis.AAC.5
MNECLYFKEVVGQLFSWPWQQFCGPIVSMLFVGLRVGPAVVPGRLQEVRFSRHSKTHDKLPLQETAGIYSRFHSPPSMVCSASDLTTASTHLRSTDGEITCRL